mgnify:CR=1 FL=1
MDASVFYVFAALAVLASLGVVVGQRNPMHSVMLLIVSFGALAGLYVLLDAPFTAVTQIIIYAGAIMVLFLFVVMLLNAHTRGCREAMPRRCSAAAAMRLGAAALGDARARARAGRCRRHRRRRRSLTDPAARSSVSSVATIGTVLFTTYAFAFEVTSILILVRDGRRASSSRGRSSTDMRVR